MTETYDSALEIMAANPDLTIEEFVATTADRGISSDVEDILDQTLNQEDILEFDERYWVMRKGRFAFTEYDHPET